ncbi:hypothetical protein CO230_05880 [Chryseobacterium sp. 6424]|uniref:M56 family metallopeptidase n=1 Tax=Chryseobacterium sp. 6424 TaxID=2039166 RepID=UPI000EFB583D|nr:M56 family metallopeptidase [Chryseobacterium sp. 6424]AYO57692.1 hypothetical protein CO230_05880 [Chryseobacterium sp. 6424]
MEALLYFGKVILASGVMFLYYQLFLKDRTFHHYNRFYLLGILVLSVLLPLMKVSYFTIEVNSGIYLLLNALSKTNSNTDLSHDFFNSEFFIYSAGLVSVFFLLRFAYSIWRIAELKKQYPKKTFESISFYQTDLEEAPFSFFRNLFWKDSILIQSDLGRQILKHEIVHMEQKHSFDRVLAEVITALFWFNPFFYLIRKEISLIHEYLADHKTIQHSDTAAFARMLLGSAFSGKPLPATSPLLSSNLKKRLKMLQKPKTKFSYVRRIAALPLVFVLTFMYMVNAENKQINLTNQQLEGYAQVVNDTIIAPPPVPEFPVVPNLRAEHKVLKAKSKEARKISQQIQKTNAVLARLKSKNKVESTAFKRFEKKMNRLGEEMNRVYQNEEFKNAFKVYSAQVFNAENIVGISSPYYQSEEFKRKIKEAQEKAHRTDIMVNSAEFRNRLREAEKRAKDAADQINSPAFQLKIRETELRAKEMEQKVNAPEFQSKLKNAAQEAKEAARRATEANLLRGKAEEDVIYYLDGKTISKAEMDKIEPKNIESMHVYKKDGRGEIHITSKK